MSSSHTPTFDLAAGWRAAREHMLVSWARLPPRWRGEPGMLVFGAVVALALLAAFHQVVHAGVDRAALRDASAHRQQAVVALCSTERDAGQRALCLLTRPTTVRGGTRMAAVR